MTSETVEIEQLRERVRELEWLLRECTDELAKRIQANYPNPLTSEQVVNAYAIEMLPVYRARAALQRWWEWNQENAFPSRNTDAGPMAR